MDADYYVIEEMLEGKEVMTNITSDDVTVIDESSPMASVVKLAKCPSCGQKTLKIEGGCHSCINKECGFSKCDV